MMCVSIRCPTIEDSGRGTYDSVDYSLITGIGFFCSGIAY